jgi:arylsulfatase
MQTGRLPNRSGMTTVAAPGQGGGLPKEELTLGDVMKGAGYSTVFIGKWHLGEADFAMPTEHGYDEMKNVLLYHLSLHVHGPEMESRLASEPAEAKRDRRTRGQGRREGP